MEKHRESYWAPVTDLQPGQPDARGIPGPSVSSTRTELRVRIYYTYEALEWRKSAAPRASGTDQASVAWPEYEIDPGERVRSQTGEAGIP